MKLRDGYFLTLDMRILSGKRLRYIKPKYIKQKIEKGEKNYDSNG